MKVYYYRLFIISFLLFIEAFCIIVIIALAKGESLAATDPTILGIALIWATIIFILSLLSFGRIIKWHQNFLIKHHYKFNVKLPAVGKVYIIRMLNKEICICSKDPNAGFKEQSEKTYLIPIDSIMSQPLTKERFPKPTRSWIQKLFN